MSRYSAANEALPNNRSTAQRQLGKRERLSIERGTAQIHQSLPARHMHVVFAIRDDSRQNRGRSHGLCLLDSLVTNKEKDQCHASAPRISCSLYPPCLHKLYALNRCSEITIRGETSEPGPIYILFFIFQKNIININ